MFRPKLILLLMFLPTLTLADMRITFINAGQADAALIQIDQDSGEPFTIVVDGGDGDSDLEDNIPGLMAGDSTVELLIVSHPHKDHTGALDRYALTATIFCTCDEALDEHHITVTVDEAGNIDTTDQVPYLVWERDSNDVLQNVTVTP